MTRWFSETPPPPADAVARSILAACMVDDKAAELCVERLTPDDFRADVVTGEERAEVFQAIAALVDRGKRPAPVMVAAEMRRLGYNRHPDDLIALATAYDGGPVGEYCEILQTYGLQWRVLELGGRLTTAARDVTLNREALLNQVEALVTQTTANVKSSHEPRRMGDVIEERFEYHLSRERGQLPGLLTGFSAIDLLLKGIMPADYLIVAARPSVGKTAFALNMASNMAAKGIKPFFVSLEQPGEQLADRMIAAEGVVNGGMLRAALIEKEHLRQARQRIESAGMMGASFYVETHARTVPEIRRAAIRQQRRGGLGIIFLDFLQRLHAHTKPGNRVLEVQDMSRAIKDMALELKVPVVVLSQLNRAVEGRQDKRPILSDLRESGDIEQDADTVAFLYREDYQQTEALKAQVETEVIVRKNRNGPIGTAKLGYIAERTKFVDL